MKIELIHRRQFRIMPWKNGSGVTAEVAISPEGSQLQDMNFDWRISSARIEGENKFSEFPGYNRVLTVLSGEGLLLNRQELGPYEIFEFEGEDPISCSLIDGPVEDLGVIFKRDQFRVEMKLLNVEGALFLRTSSETQFFFSLSHLVNISGTELEPPHFLKVEQAQSVEIKSDIYPAYLLQISIEKISSFRQ